MRKYKAMGKRQANEETKDIQIMRKRETKDIRKERKLVIY